MAMASSCNFYQMVATRFDRGVRLADSIALSMVAKRER